MRTTWLRGVSLVSLCGVLACSSAGGVDASGVKGGASGKGGASAGTGGAGGGSAGTAGVGGPGAGGGEAGGPAAGNGAAGTEDVFGPGGQAGTVSLGGSSGAGGVESCASKSEQADPHQLPADIIWVVDTSGSMSDETAAVQNRLNAFAKGILDVGIDVRVVLLAENYECPPFFGCNNPTIPPEGICLPAPLGSGNCPDDTKLPYYLHHDVTIASQDGLLRIIDSYPKWKQMLRPDSVKFIVAVTDDDAVMAPYAPSSFPDAEQGAAKKFIEDFTALDPAILTGFKMSGIYCQSDCDPWVAQVGKVWDAVVTETKGVKGDLCKQDFQPVFNELAKGVVAAATLSCYWEIPAPPDGEAFDATKVNVAFTGGDGTKEDILYAGSLDKCDPAKGGWYYDDPAQPKYVRACPSTCTHIQADTKGKIDILFGCATRPVEID